jgi:dimethylamine/trimethylamine dehydrogenase
MNRDLKYDIFLESVPIGPVTAKNRFFQVPHCNGLGHSRSWAETANRRVKAEGDCVEG